MKQLIVFFVSILLILSVWDISSAYKKQAVFSVITDTFIIPEFIYHEGFVHFEMNIRDTTYEYRFTDNIGNNQNYTPRDIRTVKDSNYFNNIKYVSLHKTWYDHEHQYKDTTGNNKPLPVSKILARYDRIGKHGWLCIDYVTHQQTDLKEIPNKIVRIDSNISNDGSRKEVYIYYGVVPIK